MEQQANAPRPYRAWLKKEKRMVNVDAIDFIHKKIAYTHKASWDCERAYADFADIILMQSTGEHDKNSVEIYGNDTVRGYVEWNLGSALMTGRVIFKKGCFYVDGIVERCDRCFSLKSFDALEIQENPELMEETK